MTVAIMQPYIFPYVGYYQLVNAVDTFVFFDDVNFINKGWINRNNLLLQDNPFRFTVPLAKASQNRLINEIELCDFTKWRNDFLKLVETSYRKAPQFSFVFNWLNEFLLKDYVFISDLASDSIKAVAKLLEFPAQFKNSGSLNYKNNSGQNGEQKILEICKMVGGDKYINPKNGIDLYNRDVFNAENIQLNFINMHEINYLQFNKAEFVANLSIIDVLMFNSIDAIKRLLTKYSLN